MSILKRQQLPAAISHLAADIVSHWPTAEVFLVGGAVRDLLLDRSTHDFDLVVRNVPARSLQRYLAKHGRVDLVGKSFGVFKFTPRSPRDAGTFDIALPRTEHVLTGSGGYKDFAIQSDHTLPIADDLSRRDFTINAIAWRLADNTLIDPFDGQRDLAARRIRTVGSPKARFTEDSSRLLRAIRFACQLGFTIEPATRRALILLAKRVNAKQGEDYIVPRETIAKELLKSLQAAPRQTLELYFQTGLLKQLLPELLATRGCQQPRKFHTEGDVWKHTLLCFDIATSAAFRRRYGVPTTTLLVAILLHDIGKPPTQLTPKRDGTDRIRFSGHDVAGAQLAANICQRLKLSAYKDDAIDCDCDAAVWLVRHHMIISSQTVAYMRATTLEKYFFSANPGELLRQLAWVDINATIAPNGKPNLTDWLAMERRLTKLSTGKQTLPKPLLNGSEIMKLCHLPGGPAIGQLLLSLREAQLTGAVKTKVAAKKFITASHLPTV